MNQKGGHRNPKVRLQAAHPSQWVVPPPPLPLHQHPLVAISLILGVGSVVQVLVWILTQRLTLGAYLHTSPAFAHGYLLEVLGSVGRFRPSITFPLLLILSLFSSVGWFATARLALGRGWGLWTGLIWVMHPGFAFLASRGSPLSLLIILVPLMLGTLAWWRYRRRRTIAAIMTGSLLGLIVLDSVLGIALAAVVFTAFLASRLRWRRRLSGVVGCAIGLALVLVPALIGSLRQNMGRELRTAASVSLRNELQKALRVEFPPAEAALATAPAQSAPAGGPAVALGAPPTLVTILASAARSPVRSVRSLIARFISTPYATADGRFERPLLALQLMWAIPAAWGAVVAYRFRPWRWLLFIAIGFTAVFWIGATLVEPLARNLTPIGGFGIMLGLIGWADLYERVFGRRLTERSPVRPEFRWRWP